LDMDGTARQLGGRVDVTYGPMGEPMTYAHMHMAMLRGPA